MYGPRTVLLGGWNFVRQFSEFRFETSQQIVLRALTKGWGQGEASSVSEKAQRELSMAHSSRPQTGLERVRSRAWTGWAGVCRFLCGAVSSGLLETRKIVYKNASDPSFDLPQLHKELSQASPESNPSTILTPTSMHVSHLRSSSPDTFSHLIGFYSH